MTVPAATTDAPVPMPVPSMPATGSPPPGALDPPPPQAASTSPANTLEAVANLFHHRTDAKYLVVVELDILVQLEILLADIAAADDGHGVVDGEGLAVHAAIGALEVHQAAPVFDQRLAGHRIEQPHLL